MGYDGFMSNSRIFLWVLLSVIAGVGVQSFVSVPLTLLFVGAIASVTILGIGAIRQKRGMWIPALFCLVFLGGMIRFAAVDARQVDASALYGRPLAIQGVIDEEPERASSYQRIAVVIASINGRDMEQSLRVLATTRQFPEYALGDEVKLRGAMEAPRQNGSFDEVSYLKRRGIATTIFYPQIERVAQGKGNQLVLRLVKIKRAFERNIDAILPEPHAAFLKGLILGERASLPPEIVEQFRATGTSHMVALSGYNITIIGSSLSRALLWATLPFAVSFWCGVTAITLFIVMTGASASVVRAGIMGILLLIAQKEGRAYRMTPALAFAAAAMVVQSPYVLRFDAGFQLSFGATLGLVYISPLVERWIDDLSRRLRRDRTARAVVGSEAKEISLAKRILIETLAAQIAVLPLLIFLFGRVSLISPVVNVLVLLATPYAMGIGFAAATLAFVSQTLGRIAAGAAWLILGYQLAVIGFFARIPLASVEPGVWIMVLLLAVYAIVFWRIRKKRAIMRVS